MSGVPAARERSDDGRPCPTESWEIIDQARSDNTTTDCLVAGSQTAQNTVASQARLDGGAIGNGSDNNRYIRWAA
jgi:hypothetical protein